MKIDRLTPTSAILTELGQRLAKVRRQQGFSQERLASAAGVGIATLRRIEDGSDSKLGSWLRLLMALQLEAGIDGWLPADFRSPMAEVRGSSRRRRKPSPPTGDGGGHGSGDGDGSGFVWGDQRS